MNISLSLTLEYGTGSCPFLPISLPIFKLLLILQFDRFESLHSPLLFPLFNVTDPKTKPIDTT